MSKRSAGEQEEREGGGKRREAGEPLLPGFTCAITQDLLVDPVVCADGHSYERDAIQTWFDTGHRTSPVTNEELETTLVYPNHALRSAIHEAHPEARVRYDSRFEERRAAARVAGVARLSAPVDDEGRTRLFVAARDGDDETVGQLIRQGAAVNQARDNGVTPLHSASAFGHGTVVGQLLGAEAAVNQADVDGMTPLFAASQEGHSTVVGQLLGAGAALNQADDDGRTPLFNSSYHGHDNVVGQLLGAGAAVNQANDGGVTPLCIASAEGHATVVGQLLGAGAAVNQAGDDGETPLYTASNTNSVVCVRILLANGANVEQCMYGYGWSPLIVAAWAGHAAVTELLLVKGADRTKATTGEHLGIAAGSTAETVAEKRGHTAVLEMLRNTW